MFTTCIDTQGNPKLCTLKSLLALEGFSSGERGSAASLANRAFTIYTAEDACASSMIPAGFQVNLFNASLQPGDRIYFEDIIVDAFDDFDQFLPRIPIQIVVMAEAGKLRSRSDWDYVEVEDAGPITLLAQFYCDERGEIAGQLLITVTP